MIKSAAFTVRGVPGLHCVSCEQRVTRVLMSVAGVRHARADAASQRIEVMFDSAETGDQVIADRLAQLGYATEPAVQRTPPDAELHHARKPDGSD